MITPRLQNSPPVPSVIDEGAALTIFSRATIDPVAPSYLTQRQQLLWMSLGIYLGILALSFIVGGLDKSRGGLQKQLVAKSLRISSLESDLTESRDQVRHFRGEVGVKNDEILRHVCRIATLEATIQRLNPFETEINRLRPQITDLLENIRVLEVVRNENRVELTRLAPFEREVNDLRPQIGPLQDTIRRKDEEIATSRLNLRNMTEEHDRTGEQYTFIQQQIAEQHQQGRELRAQLRRKEEDFLQISHQHGPLLCGSPLLRTETHRSPDGLLNDTPRGDAPAAFVVHDANADVGDKLAVDEAVVAGDVGQNHDDVPASEDRDPYTSVGSNYTISSRRWGSKNRWKANKRIAKPKLDFSHPGHSRQDVDRHDIAIPPSVTYVTNAAPEKTFAGKGILGYNGKRIIERLYFWFSDEPINPENLKENDRWEVTDQDAAWASYTGKGLLFFSRGSGEKTRPLGIINLSNVSDVIVNGPLGFFVLQGVSRHVFQARTTTERDEWVAALKEKSTEAKQLVLPHWVLQAIVRDEGYMQIIHPKVGENFVQFSGWRASLPDPPSHSSADQPFRARNNASPWQRGAGYDH